MYVGFQKRKNHQKVLTQVFHFLVLKFFSSLFSEAEDNGEAAKLESRLRSLSSGLIGLRHCLHEKGEAMLPPTFVARTSNYLQGK